MFTVFKHILSISDVAVGDSKGSQFGDYTLAHGVEYVGLFTEREGS